MIPLKIWIIKFWPANVLLEYFRNCYFFRWILLKVEYLLT